MEVELPATIEPEDFVTDIPDAMRIAVANLMFAWGAYDSAVTVWLAQVLGTPLDVASILFGNMATEAKLGKLKTIFEHYGVNDAARGMGILMSEHKGMVASRNAVAHSRCAGTLKSHPDHYAFSAVRHIKGDPGMMAVMIVSHDEVLASAAFADDASRKIMELADKTPQIVPASTHTEQHV